MTPEPGQRLENPLILICHNSHRAFYRGFCAVTSTEHCWHASLRNISPGIAKKRLENDWDKKASLPTLPSLWQLLSCGAGCRLIHRPLLHCWVQFS